MKNSEILGLQLEPTKALQPDSSSDESWKTCSTDSEPCTTRRNEASVGTWCMCLNCSQPTKKECLCCHELDACDYFKIKDLYIYLVTILQIFFIKPINEHVVMNLILVLGNGKFFSFVMTIYI